jgi:hypothetical protein
MNHPAWVGLHPAVTAEHLGYLPGFLDLADERKAAVQLNERYVHGGWRPFGQDKFKLSASNMLRYPGDPPLKPIAMAMLRDEMILLYQSDIVVIVQPDRSFEVARMD